jgi:hypothetical protein
MIGGMRADSAGSLGGGFAASPRLPRAALELTAATGAVALSITGIAGCSLFAGDDDTATDDDAGDDDASAQDDDDTDDGGTCSEAGAPGIEEDVPCRWEDGGDVFQLLVNEGEILQVTVDTVDGASTFDPRFRVVDAIGTFLFAGDDQCICEYPPSGGFLCPQGGYTAEFSENVYIHVTSFITETTDVDDVCANGVTGAYVLRVSKDGEPAIAVMTSDDGATDFDD